MPDETRILELLQEILESGRTAEAACADSPELISDVRERLQRCRAAEAQLDAMFPLTEPIVAASTYLRDGAAARLPQIPGYQMESVLGHGGMGIVFRARHLKLGRWVALKMMLSGPYAGRDELGRFAREAEAIAALRHENIVQVYDAGELDGRPFFTMEYVDGGTLAEKLAGVPQPALQAAALVAGLASAVQVAHRAGILHRDLKPANILLTTDGTPKISDFGLAWRLDNEVALTLTGARMGTPSYMAPEQVIGKHDGLGAPIDVYALGAILYEMLAGRPPFRGENALETERQVLVQEPIAPSRLNPKVPRDLETICLKCLEKDPSGRYPTAHDLATDLDRWLRGTPIVARPVGMAERIVKWARRRPAFASLVATLMLAVTAGSAIGIRIQRQENTHRLETAVRESRAREAIKTAFSLVTELRQHERWVEATHILQDTKSRLAEVNSPQQQAEFDRIAVDLRTAQELDDIRQSYAQANIVGYNFFPAHRAYSALFARIGIGPNVSPEAAGAIVRDSPIHRQLLAGLENAAFVSRVLRGPTNPELEGLLHVARLGDPGATWANRFRDPNVWRNKESLLRLVRDAGSSDVKPDVRQLVIVAVLLRSFGATADTLKVLREAQYRNAGDFWLNLELGNALYDLGQPTEACQFYRAALAVRPDNYVVLTMLGISLRDAGQKEEALVAQQNAINSNPHYLMPWSNLIEGLYQLGRFDEAENARQAAMRVDRTFEKRLPQPQKDSSVARARFLVGKQRWKAAADAYNEIADTKFMDDSEVRFEYAAVQLLAGDDAAYRQSCEHILKLSDDGAMRPFLVARAYTLAPGKKSDIERAGKLCSEELHTYGQSDWSLTEQGAICFRLGQFNEAVPMFEGSIAANNKPGAAVLNWLWLAMAHAELGHADEAKSWFRKATSWLDAIGPDIPPNSPALSFHLHNWLEAQILRREAAQSIEK